MAATKWQFYITAKQRLLNGGFDLDNTQVRMHLFKNNASLTAEMFTASLLGQIGNTCSGSGYKGAKALTVVVKLTDVSSAIMSIGTVIFSACTLGDINSIQYAVIYESVSGNLLCFCKLSTNPFNVTASNTLSIQNASGVFVLSGGSTA